MKCYAPGTKYKINMHAPTLKDLPLCDQKNQGAEYVQYDLGRRKIFAYLYICK